MPRSRNPQVDLFLLDAIDRGDKDPVGTVAQRLKIATSTAYNYLKRLIDEGVITASGRTRNRTYETLKRVVCRGQVNVQSGIEDDTVWLDVMRPLLDDVPGNVLGICSYGVTEMFNNVIDHSSAPICNYTIRRDARRLEFWLSDNGVGIFEKIKTDFDLPDRRLALLELSKGKLTSDPANHSGEGIFFTSRMFDRFMLDSLDLTYWKSRSGDGWLFEVEESNRRHQGTSVMMEIDVTTKRTSSEVFDQFLNDEMRVCQNPRADRPRPHRRGAARFSLTSSSDTCSHRTLLGAVAGFSRDSNHRSGVRRRDFSGLPS
jgi:hypothetical protein